MKRVGFTISKAAARIPAKMLFATFQTLFVHDFAGGEIESACGEIGSKVFGKIVVEGIALIIIFLV